MKYGKNGKKKRRILQKTASKTSRSGGIRTHGLLVPNQTRYQTALHLEDGADKGTRTLDLMITNQPLYQLSYIGTLVSASKGYYSKQSGKSQSLFAGFLPGIL